MEPQRHGRCRAEQTGSTGHGRSVRLAASLHLAAAIPTFEHMIIDNPLGQVLSSPAPEPVDGRLEAPTGIGLGIEVDDDRLAPFSRDPALWRSSVRN